MSALTEAQADLGSIEVEGTSGGGAVRVKANALPEIRAVEITPEALADEEMLGDLIVAAVNDALRNAAAAARDKLGGLAGGLELP